MNSFFFGDAELFSPPLIGQFLKDSFSDETILQEHEIFFLAFFTSKMISVPPLTVSSLLPPGKNMPSVLSRRGLSFPLLVVFHPNFVN